MIKNYLFCGDCHGEFSRFENIDKEYYHPEETAIIILGDAGVNFYLNKSDIKRKEYLKELGFTYYLIRGNHEERPVNIPNMKMKFDKVTKNYIYYEEDYPTIKYMIDGYTYQIDKYTALILGGAYSVDKYYRLSTAHGHKNNWTGWFPQEQLNEEERNEISKIYNGEKIDFILSHTCPFSWMPTDLFLSGIDQSKVDNSMEIWLDDIKINIKWKYWLFGHYHDDRIVAPGVEMMYKNLEDLSTFVERWEHYFETGELPWYIHKDPLFYNREKIDF